MVDQRRDAKVVELTEEEYQVMQLVLLDSDGVALTPAAARVLRNGIMPKFGVRVYADPRECGRCGE